MKRLTLPLVLLLALPAAAQDTPQVDLLAMPSALRKRNIAAKGLGCCVFRSIDYASHWQNVPALHGFPEWMVQNGVAGGGWPEKVDDLIPKVCRSRNLPVPPYVQYEGRDPAVIELALKTGRCPGVTWNGNHMLTCVYLDESRGAILDNNAPDRVQWFSRAEFLRRWTAGGGGWVFVLLSPGPTPPPAGARAESHEPTPPGGVMLDYRWEPASGNPRGKVLFREGRQAGFWDGEKYLPLLPDGRWGEPCEPPCEVPFEELPGVVQWKPRQERYSVCGRPAPPEEAMAALAGAGGGLADDSARPFLTVIGPAAERAAVLADLEAHPALQAFRGKFRVQSYDPGDWAVQSFGFQAGGSPTVYLQAADGRVLHRQDDYAGGPAGLADALRRADPSYRPDQDPDRRKPEPGPAVPGPSVPSPLKEIPMEGGCAAIALAAYLLGRQSRNKASGQ